MFMQQMSPVILWRFEPCTSAQHIISGLELYGQVATVYTGINECPWVRRQALVSSLGVLGVPFSARNFSHPDTRQNSQERGYIDAAALNLRLNPLIQAQCLKQCNVINQNAYL